MGNCIDYRHITVSGTTNEEIWREVSLITGPRQIDSPQVIDRMNSDIAAFEAWVLEHHPVPFERWLIWRKRVGTENYGNLPTDKKHLKKVGHLYAPCPYSTQSTPLRTRHLLHLTREESLPTRVDHSSADATYYMKTASRGANWGFECTFLGCPYFISTGERYFFT